MGSSIRNISKSTIIDVTLIKNTIIKIDIGQGPLHNIFLPFEEVVTPVLATPEQLCQAIDNMREMPVQDGGNAAGGATEANQLVEISQLASISSAIGSLNQFVNTIDAKLFYEPKLVDDSGAGIIYKGFTLNNGSNEGEPVWAIQRIAVDDKGVHVYAWADGNKNFDKVWADRDILFYQ